jgi:hypothetical protein
VLGFHRSLALSPAKACLINHRVEQPFMPAAHLQKHRALAPAHSVSDHFITACIFQTKPTTNY